MAYVAKCTNSSPTPITLPNPLSYSPSSSSAAAAANFASPPTSQPSSPPPAVVLSPCAACKILRRRCVEKCVLAPYFPPTEPLKFTIAHRVFGASNIIKFLQVRQKKLNFFDFCDEKNLFFFLLKWFDNSKIFWGFLSSTPNVIHI